MNYNDVFRKCQEQYAKMEKFMQNINVCVGILRENNSTQTINNKKILKRVARIEDKLKITNIEEGD